MATAVFGNIVDTITGLPGGDDPNAGLHAFDDGSELLFWVVVSFLISGPLVKALIWWLVAQAGREKTAVAVLASDPSAAIEAAPGASHPVNREAHPAGR